MTIPGKACLYVFSTMVLALFAEIPVQAKTNLLFILDGSNSMWGQVDGEAKITSAQNVLAGLLRELPADIQTGLMAYGHRKEGSCDDIEVLSEIGNSNIDTLTKKINTIQPKGKTPIAGALQKSLGVLSKYENDNNNVVLISDGIESCDGDPCAAAKALADAGINARVHVVGFDVGAEEREQLKCIPDMGNGKYFSAANAAELKLAAAEVKEVAVAEPPPPPPQPQATIWLEDNFEGEDLADHWEILNPDPDSFIVENGELLIINSTPAAFAKENITNLIRLNRELPKGNWIATMKLNVDFQSGQELVFFGLYDDKDNYLVNQLTTAYDQNHARHYLFVSPTKTLKGKIVSSRNNIWGEKKGDDLSPGLFEAQPFLLRIEKKGRAYINSIKLEGIEEPKWIDFPELKLLRSKGNLAFGVFQSNQGSGETSLMIDWIKIETMQEPEGAQPADEEPEETESEE